MATSLSQGELERELRKHGFEKLKKGAKHEKWSDGKRTILVPRTLKAEGTLLAILKAAGIPHPKKQIKKKSTDEPSGGGTP